MHGAKRGEKAEITSKPYLSQYCRKHLLSHLEGNIAWLHQEDAIAQRERLKQERIAAREQRAEPVNEVQQLNENVPDGNFEPLESECEDFEEDEEMGMEMSM